MLGYAMLRVCNGCKDVLDTDQDGAALAPCPIRAN